MPAAVEVVELRLRDGVVDVDRGEPQHGTTPSLSAFSAKSDSPPPQGGREHTEFAAQSEDNSQNFPRHAASARAPFSGAVIAPGCFDVGNLVLAVAELFAQDLVGVLAKERRALHLRDRVPTS